MVSHKSFYESVVDSQLLKVISVPWGVGKTEDAIRYIKENTLSSNFLLVVPSQKLADEIDRRFQPMSVTVIHGGTVGVDENGDQRPVVRAIKDFMLSAPSRGEILVITMAACLWLFKLPRRESWSVIIDETPQVDRFWEFDNDFMADIKTLIRDIDDDSLVSWDRKAVLKLQTSWKEKKLDERERLISLFLWDALCPSKQMFFRQAKERTYFLSLLKPQLFQGVILMGAYVEKTMLFDWLTRHHKVSWTISELMSERRLLVAPWEQEQSRKSFRLLWTIADWFSKNKRDNATLKGSRGKFWDQALELHQRRFEGRRVAYTLNNDIPNGLGLSGWTRMPADPRGLNEWGDYDCAFLGSAMNRKPEQVKMLKELTGFSQEVIEDDVVLTSCQAAFRINRRGGEGVGEVAVISKALAERMAELMKPVVDVAVERIGELEIEVDKGGRSALGARALSAAEKKRRSRALQEIKGSDVGFGLMSPNLLKIDILRDFGDIPEKTSVPENFTPFDPMPYGGSIVPSLYENPTDFIDLPWHEFLDWLQSYHDRDLRAAYPGLDKNKLKAKNGGLVQSWLNVAAYVQDFKAGKFDKETAIARRDEYAAFSSILLFDGDFAAGQSSLSHQAFRQLFPNIGGFAYNSISSTQERPKWRAGLRLNRYVTPDELRALQRFAFLRLPKDHGLNSSKQFPSALFFLPSRPYDTDNGAHFFERWEGRPLDADKALSLLRAYEAIIPGATKEEAPQQTITGDPSKVIQSLSLLPKGSGRHVPAFLAVKKLKKLGLDKHEAKLETSNLWTDQEGRRHIKCALDSVYH